MSFTLLIYISVWFHLCNAITDVTLTIDPTTTIANIPIPFYGFTFDYGNTNGANSSEWAGAGILDVDLSNHDLIAYAKELSPALLRVGGSAEDEIIYNTTKGECLQYENGHKGPPLCGSGTDNNHPNLGKKYLACLNMSRWQQINEFVVKTNLTFLYGLNACYGRSSPSKEMNFSNIEALFNVTATFPSSITSNLYSFEFGNEIASSINADIYAKDFYNVHNLINKIWNNNVRKPVLMGPDAMGHADKYIWNKAVLDNLLKINNNNKSMMSSVMNRFTYHFYPKCVYWGNITGMPTIFNMSCLETIVLYASNNSKLASKYDLITYMGEGAEYSHGGTDSVTNTFADSFYYIYQLCEVLKNGIRGTLRSTLMGGDYELIDNHKIIANPDYWILYVWKKLIGYKMYDVTMKNDYLRGYAFEVLDNGNGYVIPLINFHMMNEYVVNIEVKDKNISSFNCLMYHVYGSGNELQTKQVYVNKVKMEYVNGVFPNLEGESCNSSIVMPPTSIMFVVLTPLK